MAKETKKIEDKQTSDKEEATPVVDTARRTLLRNGFVQRRTLSDDDKRLVVTSLNRGVHIGKRFEPRSEPIFVVVPGEHYQVSPTDHSFESSVACFYSARAAHLHALGVSGSLGPRPIPDNGRTLSGPIKFDPAQPIHVVATNDFPFCRAFLFKRHLALAPALEEALADIERAEGKLDSKAASAFFDRFGTHYVDQADFGGRISLTRVVPCDSIDAVRRAKCAAQKELAAARVRLAAPERVLRTTATEQDSKAVPLSYLPSLSFGVDGVDNGINGVGWMAALLTDSSCWGRIQTSYFYPLWSLLPKDSAAQQQLIELTEYVVFLRGSWWSFVV